MMTASPVEAQAQAEAEAKAQAEAKAEDHSAYLSEDKKIKITRDQWTDGFTADLEKVEKKYAKVKLEPIDKEFFANMKKIPAFLKQAAHESSYERSYQIAMLAKQQGKLFFDDNDAVRGNVPTGQFAKDVFECYGKFADRYQRVNNLPMGYGLVAPNYKKRSESTQEYKADPTGYVAKKQAAEALEKRNQCH